MSFGAKEIPNQPKWNPTVYNFRVPHALALVESKNLICVADRENGAVQCFDNKNGTFQFTVPVPATLSKIYSIDADGTHIAVLGGPDSRSNSKLIVYDLESNNLAEAIIDHSAPFQSVSNPHDVAVTQNGKKVIVANLRPSQIWLFSDEISNKQKEPERFGKAMPVVAASESNKDNSGPKTLPIQEKSESIVVKTASSDKDTPLWKSFGLLVVFVTGLAMIFYYVRIRRRKNQGFQPLNQKEED